MKRRNTQAPIFFQNGYATWIPQRGQYKWLLRGVKQRGQLSDSALDTPTGYLRIDFYSTTRTPLSEKR